MKTSRILLSLLSAFSLPLIADAAPDSYEQVKSLLNQSTGAIDFIDADEMAARSTLRSKADEYVAALEALFSENENDGYRTAIISVLSHADNSQQKVSAFLVDQLKKSPEFNGAGGQLPEKTWIRVAFKLLIKIDPSTARTISREALTSPNLCVQGAALQALEQAGTKDDVTLLNAYASFQTADKTKSIPVELASYARNISDQIKRDPNR